MLFNDHYTFRVPVFLLIIVFVFSSEVLQTQIYESDKLKTAIDYISLAKKRLSENQFEDVLLVLRKFRLRYPESKYVVESLVIGAKAAVALDNTYQERFLLTKALSSAQKLEKESQYSVADFINLQIDILIRLAIIFENEKEYLKSYGYFKQAIDKSLLFPGSISAKELNTLLLSAANTAYSSGAVSHQISRDYLYSINIEKLGNLELETLKRLAKSLKWEYLSAVDLGFKQLNVSVLSVDEDDLWVGSWTGGLSRYSLASKTQKVFSSSQNALSPTSIRDILRFDRYVWVGTDQGLSVYSRASSRWRKEVITGLNSPLNKISSIVAYKNNLFVGTLGGGLWKKTNDEWSIISTVGLPGSFISTLEIIGEFLWIGTIDLGLIRMSIKTNEIISFDDINPSMGPQNITDIVSDDGVVWIATFGSGIFRWESTENRVTHFTAENSFIPDNWVLSGAVGRLGVYFGTFGGGAVQFIPSSSEWKTIGLSDGLPSLDVSTVFAVDSGVYFGTLGSGVAVLSETLHGIVM